ncbi:hypothetical protein DV515_00012168 [Chloebia gouldiae]|uniref:Uncharacterized protein n=1 Tax=Chloebia gouldiae TaxID=44316 RepID=A0A3L8S594_CHLGU|nr:hypothetical protein DV515_00012168 [Chloebia gouldiae]
MGSLLAGQYVVTTYSRTAAKIRTGGIKTRGKTCSYPYATNTNMWESEQLGIVTRVLGSSLGSIKAYNLWRLGTRSKEKEIQEFKFHRCCQSMPERASSPVHGLLLPACAQIPLSKALHGAAAGLVMERDGCKHKTIISLCTIVPAPSTKEQRATQALIHYFGI